MFCCKRVLFDHDLRAGNAGFLKQPADFLCRPYQIFQAVEDTDLIRACLADLDIRMVIGWDVDINFQANSDNLFNFPLLVICAHEPAGIGDIPCGESLWYSNRNCIK